MWPVSQAHSRTSPHRKKTELSLLDTKRRLELAKSSAGIGVWVYNPVTLELEWDEQMFQIFDFAEDEFPNTYEGWRQTVHPEDLAKAETDLTEALESLESFHSSFRIIHKSDKSVHYIEAHAHIVRDEDGHAVEVFGVNWDITESKLAEKEREDL